MSYAQDKGKLKQGTTLMEGPGSSSTSETLRSLEPEALTLPEPQILPKALSPPQLLKLPSSLQILDPLAMKSRSYQIRSLAYRITKLVFTHI